MNNGPLTGVRIADLSTAIAGAFGTLVMGDLGAEIIKIESPEGDFVRTISGPTHKGENFYYMAFNRSKKSMVLDLRTPTGREAFYDLVKKCDVVWDNFRPGTMAHLGADVETLKKLNPKLICCSVSGYGANSSYKHRTSNDICSLSLAGVLSVTGEPGGPPIRPGPPYGDLVAALFGVIGVLSELVARKQGAALGEIDISLLDCSVAMMCYHLSSYLCGGKVPGPQGTGHEGLSPYGAFKTQDGYVVIGPTWPRIAKVVGAEWIIDDPRFNTHTGRVEHKEELRQILAEQFIKAKTEQWVALFDAEDIAGAPLLRIDETVRHPLVNERNMILSLEHSLGGKIRVAGNPVKIKGVKEEYLPPPTLGQHTDEILTKMIGYSPEKISKLKKEQEEHAAELHSHLHKFF